MVCRTHKWDPVVFWNNGRQGLWNMPRLRNYNSNSFSSSSIEKIKKKQKKLHNDS